MNKELNVNNMFSNSDDTKKHFEMYEKYDIEEMLKSYLLSKSQLEELESKIEKNNILLKYNGTEFEESEAEAIEAMTLKSSTIPDIPKSKTNKKTDITANIALTYKEKLKYTNKADKIKLINENVRYNEKAEPLRDLVEKVERMLRALNNEQKLIVKSYYMFEQKWNYVSITYTDAYKTPITINQLKNIRNTAMQTMLKVINI